VPCTFGTHSERSAVVAKVSSSLDIVVTLSFLAKLLRFESVYVAVGRTSHKVMDGFS